MAPLGYPPQMSDIKQMITEGKTARIISNFRGANGSLRLSTTDVRYKANDHRRQD